MSDEARPAERQQESRLHPIRIAATHMILLCFSCCSLSYSMYVHMIMFVFAFRFSCRLCSPLIDCCFFLFPRKPIALAQWVNRRMAVFRSPRFVPSAFHRTIRTAADWIWRRHHDEYSNCRPDQHPTASDGSTYSPFNAAASVHSPTYPMRRPLTRSTRRTSP